jgi:hypothetical protein
MKTNLIAIRTLSIRPWLALVSLVAVGCFSTPSPDIANRICTTEQQCPVGYSCLAPGKAGGCCKPGTPCPTLSASDGASLDMSPADMRVASETPIDTGNGDTSGTVPGDAPLGIDQSADGAGGPVDANSPGGADGAATGGVGGSIDASGAGAGGATTATGGVTGAGGNATTGGTMAQGGAGGTPDAGPLDDALDAPGRDVVPEANPDAPGSCGADKECPAQSPLCLANKCAKCAADSDCVGRTGTPACAASSGLCVACTADSYCTADPSKAFCVTNACVGCNAPGASGCSTRTDGNTTCATSGTVAGQCVACAPSSTQCSATGVPQLCSASGVWQDQTACQTDNICAPATGKCTCTKTACSATSCVDTQGTDASNCGSCGHGCGAGGVCTGGQCQPVAVVANAGTGAKVIGVDDSNVYYYTFDPTGSNAFQVSKGASGGSGLLVDNQNTGGTYYIGVIGGKLFSGNRGSYYMCDFSSADATHCAATMVSVPGAGGGAGNLVPFKSTSQQTIAVLNTTDSSYASITWYSTTTYTQVQSFGENVFSGAYSYDSPFAFGDTVYWMRLLYDASFTLTDAMLYSTSVTKPSLTAFSDNVAVDTYQVIDANTMSVLISGPNNGLYRVALPGNAAAIPPLLIGLGSYSVLAATEDTNAVYWMQSNGNLFSCSSSNCGGTKKALAAGQTLTGDLYQDTSALYWSNGGQIMRLAK